MGDEFNAGKYGAIFPLVFGVANAVTNQTATDLTLSDATYVNTLAVMPKSGSIIGISVRASAAVTAGTAAFRAHKDGTEFSQTGYPNPALSSTAGVSQESYASTRAGNLTFAADEAIGVSYASATDMAPTNTNDFTVLLFVQLDPN
jgi:hypothetical protein